MPQSSCAPAVPRSRPSSAARTPPPTLSPAVSQTSLPPHPTSLLSSRPRATAPRTLPLFLALTAHQLRTLSTRARRTHLRTPLRASGMSTTTPRHTTMPLRPLPRLLLRASSSSPLMRSSPRTPRPMLRPSSRASLANRTSGLAAFPARKLFIKSCFYHS